jgi:hypothetical protein
MPHPTPTSRISGWLWAAAAVAALTSAAGYLGLAIGTPWLFASLGPTIFLHALRPADETGRFYNTVAGHGMAAAAGWAALLVFGGSDLPAGSLSGERVGASVAALAATVLLQLATRAPHPPAAATTLLVTLGQLAPAWRDLAGLAAGVLLVAALGEAMRRLRAG